MAAIKSNLISPSAHILYLWVDLALWAMGF